MLPKPFDLGDPFQASVAFGKQNMDNFSGSWMKIWVPVPRSSDFRCLGNKSETTRTSSYPSFEHQLHAYCVFSFFLFGEGSADPVVFKAPGSVFRDNGDNML